MRFKIGTINHNWHLLFEKFAENNYPDSGFEKYRFGL